ncbi:MAG: hypothetical protein A3A65_04740 [Candidatus Chisholmbacteria bacterium RIFCSPLOWO2_01_FULL_49_14]|uniref:DUF5678 domain-containing protein n=1 Tax=Candidatus Chisholmbacteria bacterium RIFCSPLOWO2_01_FULL_49_14 TaxID=1797593 RepID=A0A1G1W468_9BACT|nr:MAG: hypothetical protein A3A65_04740 [Candidatus Chisholmbacteria bacterium RIFCSPLOWO2_01_FULL_49_14]
MKKVNVSVEKLPRFSGKWVAIKNERIIAFGESLEDISEFVVGTKKHPPKAGAFRVPEKRKGPYIFSSPR